MTSLFLPHESTAAAAPGDMQSFAAAAAVAAACGSGDGVHAW